MREGLGSMETAPSGPQRAIPVGRALASYCRERKMRFVVSDSPEPAIRVLMPESFMPVLAIHAEVAAVELLRPGVGAPSVRIVSDTIYRGLSSPGTHARLPLGTQVREDEGALFGVLATVPPLSGDGRGSLRAALFVYALHKIFGFGADRTIELSSIYSRYAGEGLRGILGAIESPAQEIPWQPALPR